MDKLGFERVEDTDLGGGKRWVRVRPSGSNGASILLARAVSEKQRGSIGNQAGGRVFVFLETDDFWRDYNRLVERGVTFVRPPSKEPYGTVAVFEDLYGNRFDLIGRVDQEAWRMAYDEGLAERIRSVLEDERGVSEKRMFGGIAFLLDGKMFVGIATGDLMVRVGPERYEESLRQPHVRPMDFTGKPMAGYVFVAPAGVSEESDLGKWVRLGATFVAGLPEKTRLRRSKKTKAPSRSRSR